MPPTHRNTLISGGMIFTFYRAEGYSTGASLVEEDKIELAKQLIESAKVLDSCVFEGESREAGAC